MSTVNTDRSTRRPKPRKRRNYIEPRGTLAPANWYTAKGLNRAVGIGEELLATMRGSGLVKAYQMGARLMYRGSDVIAWIEAQAK